MAFIKSLIAGVERLIHGGKHYPVVDGVAKVPQDVRDELVNHTHWTDLNHGISEEIVKALSQPEEASEAVGKPEVKVEDPNLKVEGELAEAEVVKVEDPAPEVEVKAEAAPKEVPAPVETAEAEVANKPAKSSKKDK